MLLAFCFFLLCVAWALQEPFPFFPFQQPIDHMLHRVVWYSGLCVLAETLCFLPATVFLDADPCLAVFVCS